MEYRSTRSNIRVKDYDGLIKGISDDGGLFVPVSIPKINIDDLMDKSYNDICFHILSCFFDADKFNLQVSIDKAYENFSADEKVPVKDFENFGFIELFHGPTLAFKDMALKLLPHLMSRALELENENKELLILTATSGDTGSAALEGFKGLDNIRILVLYPTVGVSNIQELQMLAVTEDNAKVLSINGNFDDAQTSVKEIFANKSLKEKSKELNRYLSSANSINIGRFIPQIVYYFSSYIDIVKKGKIKMGDKVNIVVPTGNFGNILASYMANQMGLPVNKFICASNKNNVLTEFFNTGVYHLDREFNVTMSPSMDILISSNLERLIYFKLGEEKTLELMNDLKTNKRYEVDKNLFNEFYANFASEEETSQEIKRILDEESYLIDPHTSVATVVYRKYVEETGDNTYSLIAATASPYKFSGTVCESIDIDFKNDFESCREIEKTAGMKIPSVIHSLEKVKVTKRTIETEEILKEVIDFME